ncbi:MAG: hypothetical protein Q4G69_06860 [Planctomycetia bacterium]|nr:hypothetical protein [Planctomycetia bacterium]
MLLLGSENRESPVFQSLSDADTGNFNNPSLYIRGVRSKSGTLNALQTSIIRFTGSRQHPDLCIDLIGVIHFAEKEYYEKLNQIFQEYDAVLYEMVIPAGMDYRQMAQSLKKESLRKQEPQKEDFSFKFSPRKRPADPQILLELFAKAQDWLGNRLKLVDQTTWIDYTPQNMIHADIDSETFLKEIVEKGEIVDFFYQSILDSMFSASNHGPSSILLFFARDRTTALKRKVAEALLVSIDEDLKNTTIIGLRNRIAFRELTKTVEQGPKKIALFYGSAHLSYFSLLLQEKFQFQSWKIRWLTAWSMPSVKEPIKPK